MKNATYIGPVAHLQGETALVRPHQEGELLAQFDCIDLEDEDDNKLGFGWHVFPEECFEVDEDETE